MAQSIYKEVQSRAWYNDLYNKTYNNVQYDVTDNGEDEGHVNNYVLEWLVTNEGYDPVDYILLLEFQDGFDNWTEGIFNVVDSKIRRQLKEFLRSRGIYILLN